MFMFSRSGVIVIEAEGLDEDTVMEDALDAGADDFSAEGDFFEILTAPNDLGIVTKALEDKGYSFVSCEVAYLPSTKTSLSDEDAVTNMTKLLDALEENDDVQGVWHNWENDEE